MGIPPPGVECPLASHVPLLATGTLPRFLLLGLYVLSHGGCLGVVVSASAMLRVLRAPLAGTPFSVNSVSPCVTRPLRRPRLRLLHGELVFYLE